jgi:hypothetical protein
MRARPERLFYFRLAAHLGYTVGELLARISSYELAEWVAVERLTGTLGPARGDLHAGTITAALVNAHKKKGARASRPGDFFRWDRQEQTPDDMWQIAVAMNARLGGTVREVREPTE